MLHAKFSGGPTLRYVQLIGLKNGMNKENKVYSLVISTHEYKMAETRAVNSIFLRTEPLSNKDPLCFIQAYIH